MSSPVSHTVIPGEGAGAEQPCLGTSAAHRPQASAHRGLGRFTRSFAVQKARRPCGEGRHRIHSVPQHSLAMRPVWNRVA